MAEKDWAAILKNEDRILKNEDRIIANSDRRFRYHCYSLESMSEELTYKERSIYIQDDFTEQLMVEDFIDTVRNEKLAYGLRRLTDRQRFAIEPRRLQSSLAAHRQRSHFCFKGPFTGSAAS